MKNGFKTVAVPFVDGLEEMNWNDRQNKMELNGSKIAVDEVNWPDEYPYKPLMAVTLAGSENRLWIMYHFMGLDLRATVMEDNGPVYEDSCCEFFISDPSDGTYLNFEMNCIGTLLASRRTSRTDCIHFGSGELGRVDRYSSLERRQYDMKGGRFFWEAGLGIPFDLIGFKGFPEGATARVNFYGCGDKCEHVRFLSWNPIVAPAPDFHRPEYFGEMTFMRLTDNHNI